MTGIDTRNSRRGYFHKCTYYKKVNHNDSSLKHEETPNGVFFAKQVKDMFFDSDTIYGVYQNSYKSVTIETPDDVSIEKNDIVNYRDEDWIVLQVEEREIVKRSEFSNFVSSYKVIALRK